MAVPARRVPKAIRASAGSIFRVPLVTGVSLSGALEALAESQVRLFAAMPGAAKPISETDFREPCAIAVGSEGRGVRPEIAAQACAIRIPTRNVESLNAAVAASVILYEASRQRQLTP